MTALQRNESYKGLFIIHNSSFIILHSTFCILHYLQVLQNVLRQLVVQARAGVSAHDEVVLVGEEELVVVDAGFVKTFHKLHSVLEVDIVVGGAVNQQVFAF